MPSRRRPRATASATRGSSSATSTRMRSTLARSIARSAGRRPSDAAARWRRSAGAAPDGQLTQPRPASVPAMLDDDTAREARTGPGDGALRVQARHRRPGRDARARARRAAGRRPRAARGRARAGQDADRQDARRRCSAGTSAACSSRPTSCPPTSSARASGGPTTASSDTELGPVFSNLLLADEINRAPAKVQSALLEVMQERQVTIGGTTHRLPAPFLVLATQNPIESEGTYALPEAQVDRFLFKLARRLPVGRGRGRPSSTARRPARPSRERRARSRDLLRYRAIAREVFVDRRVIGLRRPPGRRDPPPGALRARRPRRRSIEYGASPRGPIGLIQAGAGARAAARPRPRDRDRRRRPRARRAAPPPRAVLRRAGRRRPARRPRARPGRVDRDRAAGPRA